MNNIYNLLNNQKGGIGNMQNIMEQFSQFRRNFSGNPQETVERLLKNGSISQEQFNQAVQMANQFQKMIGK